MFAREGYPFIIGAAALAALLFAAALRMRSWPLWLAAFLVTVIALWVAWFFRDPARVGERGPNVVISLVDGARMDLIRIGSRVDVFLPPTSSLLVAVGQRTKVGVTVIAQFPNS